MQICSILGFISDLFSILIISTSFTNVLARFKVSLLILAEKNISCRSFIVDFIISFIITGLFLDNKLSASSSTIVLIVWAVIFFFLIKSRILPGEPTIMCGLTSFSFFICFSMLDSPIIDKDVTFMPELVDRSFICDSIWTTNS